MYVDARPRPYLVSAYIVLPVPPRQRLQGRLIIAVVPELIAYSSIVFKVQA